ncbi:MAG: hypothetical protein JO036_19870 [Candidatus Eremiobacteraeota bacterium]|nr:hypothetical protein [Candidatus Eremiobacteraeota bacterium]
MAAEFISLAERLAAVASLSSGRDARAADPVAERVEDAPAQSFEQPSSVAAPDRDHDVTEAVREARLFRARVADAFADAAQRLLRELACEVLARELRLAPCDLAALVQRVRERVPVVRLRVAANDLGAVTGLPVVADPALQAGDAVLELAGGALDARLGVRLAAVLEAFA